MKLAIEHLQKEIRILESKLQSATSAYSSEQKQADSRKAEMAAVSATLAELRAALAVLNGKPMVESVAAPAAEQKKKRA